MSVYTPVTYNKDLSAELTTGTAISIVDGRYGERLRTLRNKFSEAALQRSRTAMEIRYLTGLSSLGVVRPFRGQELQFLHSLYQDFGIDNFRRVKEIERKDARGADVKAVELYIKERLKGTSLEDVIEMVHFALTSEDPTNIALMSLTHQAVREDYLPPLVDVIERLAEMATAYKDTAMLARTHGRAAQPTTFGKEMGIVAKRVVEWVSKIYGIKLEGKLGGAVGNLSDHYAAYPDINWIRFAEDFVASFGLVPNTSPTQILPYDRAIELFGNIQDANKVLIGLSQDMWRYISDDWILLKRGGISSVMPQKVNPESFERAEGALQISNNDFDFLGEKLATSRLQRDLSNSLATRMFGNAFGLSILGYRNLSEGLGDSEPDAEQMRVALRSHPEILSSMMQTILRRAGLSRPYDTLQDLTRGKKVSLGDLQAFANGLEADDSVKQQLLALNPETAYGAAPRIAERDATYVRDAVKRMKEELDIENQ